MTQNSSDKSMLGGCCICLDERGWDENPLVYCDGQGCPIAVHQACYGIVTVPSGPWFCRRCEVFNKPIPLQCDLCPHQDGALKKTDNNSWAHVVCALYIPEVEFGNVSTMEPIVLQKIPEDRYNKPCCVCDENGENEKKQGACMTCAKTGCSKSFHVTCAQMSGLLCEEAGGSNTTKYCGYCSQHLSKHKKANPFKNLTFSKVYKLSSTPSQVVLNQPTSPSPIDDSKSSHANADIENHRDSCENKKRSEASQNEIPVSSPQEGSKPDIVVQDIPSERSISSALSSLAEVACTALEKAQQTIVDEEVKQKSLSQKEEGSKKTKRKNVKTVDKEGKRAKPKKMKLTSANPPIKTERLKHDIDSALLEDVGYAMAPKHSVVSLSSFGISSIEPSHPSDIGETKPVPTTHFDKCDGLTAIEKMIDHQKGDLMKFFQDFGTSPDVSQILHSLQDMREKNSQLEKAIEKMTHRRDQLLAIKARLSVPLKSPQFNRVCPNTSDSSMPEIKQFVSSAHDQQYSTTYPYFQNKQ